MVIPKIAINRVYGSVRDTPVAMHSKEGKMGMKDLTETTFNINNDIRLVRRQTSKGERSYILISSGKVEINEYHVKSMKRIMDGEEG